MLSVLTRCYIMKLFKDKCECSCAAVCVAILLLNPHCGDEPDYYHSNCVNFLQWRSKTCLTFRVDRQKCVFSDRPGLLPLGATCTDVERRLLEIDLGNQTHYLGRPTEDTLGWVQFVSRGDTVHSPGGQWYLITTGYASTFLVQRAGSRDTVLTLLGGYRGPVSELPLEWANQPHTPDADQVTELQE